MTSKLRLNHPSGGFNMLEHLIEELEKILYETSKLKDDLNNSCERGWSLLCPSGSQINGFKIQKELPPSDKDESSNASNISPSLGGVFDKVTELITYGKELRNSAKLENKKSSSNVTLNVKGDLRNQPQLNKSKINLTKSGSNSIPVAPRGGHKVNRCNFKSKKVADSKHSLDTLTSDKTLHDLPLSSSEIRNSVSISHAEDQECPDNVTKTYLLKDNQMLTKDSNNGSALTPKYSHSCSVTLSDLVKTLKMPEDMHHLLKCYFQYQNYKLKHHVNKEEHNSLDFSKRINNLAKLKLGIDLRTNVKERDRHMKYLDVADEVCRSGKARTVLDKSSIIWYQSKEQLCSYEVKCQQLLELQLQRRLMAVLEACLK
ncbi:uncharacterized protein LOC124353172 isoform X1 [Homalodisca vitripennis]|uniref:uncharacterized protein LOC124353172 isoform X1 n=1 Tax=Homalodisca vitripennis TaxID=197043 RepID=UPI001EEBD66D|nr:uncharacterized protein LOC124353172 isoform X1 [Homalodisca vitripennis]